MALEATQNAWYGTISNYIPLWVEIFARWNFPKTGPVKMRSNDPFTKIFSVHPQLSDKLNCFPCVCLQSKLKSSKTKNYTNIRNSGWLITKTVKQLIFSRTNWEKPTVNIQKYQKWAVSNCPCNRSSFDWGESADALSSKIFLIPSVMKIWTILCWCSLTRGPPRGKRDGVIGHISKRENVNWITNCVIAW